MCKCWRWQEPFFKRTPRSPPLHRRGWQALWLGAQTVQQHMPVMTFPQRPGLHWWAKAGGKKDSSVHTVTQTPPVSPRSVQNPLGTPFSHLFSALLCLLRHINGHQHYSQANNTLLMNSELFTGDIFGMLARLSLLFVFFIYLLVQHNIALLWEFMQMHWAGYDCNYALIYTAVADHFAIRGCGCVYFIFAFEFTGNFFHFF